MTNETTRIPPQNKELELTVIGASLIDEKGGLQALLKYSNTVEPDLSEIFYYPNNRNIVKGILSLCQQNIVPDILSVPIECDRLLLEIEKNTLIDATVGVSSSSFDTIEYYIKKLIELYLKRLIIQESTAIIDEAYTKQSTQLSLIEKNRALLNRTQNLIPSNIKIITPENIVDERINGLKKRRNNIRRLTGWESVNKYLSEGFNGGLLTTIGGPKSSGKTAMVTNLIENQCDKQKLKVYWAVPEMLTQGSLDRLQAIRTGIPLSDIKRIRDWNENDQRADILAQDIEYIAHNWKLFLDGNRGVTIATYLNRIEDVMNKEGGLDVIYFDTMNSIPDIAVCRSDKEKFGEIMNQLEIFADNKQVHIVMVAHFNNYIYHRKDRTPNTSDLDFGAIYDEKSHNIFFTTRNFVFDKEAEDNEITIWIAKQRDGPTGKVEMEWIKETTKIVDPLQSNRPKIDKKSINFDLSQIE